MNRRTFFGALVGGTVSCTTSSQGAVRNTRTPNRFTQATKFGDYFFYWTGWKRETAAVVNVAQWIAEPVEGLEGQGWERPAFYASTSGTSGPIANMHFVMDLSYQPGFPFISDKSSPDDKREAKKEALERLIKYIESWEVPQVNYASTGHISDRRGLRPGALIDGDFPLSETLGRVLKRDGLTARAFKKAVKNV